jgi:hypothetical protein
MNVRPESDSLGLPGFDSRSDQQFNSSLSSPERI